jgi:hypothetical protein
VTAPSPDECFVFAPDAYIEHVEIRFVRSEGRRLGFSHRTLDDPPSSSSDE